MAPRRNDLLVIVTPKQKRWSYPPRRNSVTILNILRESKERRHLIRKGIGLPPVRKLKDLTPPVIDKSQNYFGIALRANCTSGEYAKGDMCS